MNATPTSQRGSRRMRGDEGLYVQFSTEAVESEFKSKLEARPVYDDVEMIEIRIPGDDKTIIKNAVSAEYRERFPDEYAAFKANAQVTTSGIPLEHWALLSKSRIAELKHVGVLSVEDLAGLSDSVAQQFMGGLDLREKAKAYIKSATDTAVVAKQEAEMAELREQIAALKAEKKTK